MSDFSERAKKIAGNVEKCGKAAVENTQRIAKGIGDKSAVVAHRTKDTIGNAIHKNNQSSKNTTDEYVTKKKDMKFKSLDSLQSVVNVVNDAAAALNDKSRTINDSAIPEALAGALGAGIGGVGSFAALYGLGTVGLSAAGITSGLATAGAVVGGGMVAGVFVLAAPVAILAGTSVGVATRMKNKQLRLEKERLYQEVVVVVSELNAKGSFPFPLLLGLSFLEHDENTLHIIINERKIEIILFISITSVHKINIQSISRIVCTHYRIS